MKVIETLGKEPETIAFVDVHMSNLQMAASCGCKTVLIRHTLNDRAKASTLETRNLILNNIMDIRSIIVTQSLQPMPVAEINLEDDSLTKDPINNSNSPVITPKCLFPTEEKQTEKESVMSPLETLPKQFAESMSEALKETTHDTEKHRAALQTSYYLKLLKQKTITKNRTQ